MRKLALILMNLILIGCYGKQGVKITPRSPRPVPNVNCPSGYVAVPAVSGYTSTALCVGKYEAQIVGGKAISQAGLPSVVRKRSDAAAACSALGSKYALITNAQWQAVARNIESVSQNWSGSSVGNGALSLGHCDMDPDDYIASGSDSNGCVNTNDPDCGENSWYFQKRTFKLSNGQIIWDFAGNLSEWVSDLPVADISSLQSGGIEAMNITDSVLKKLFGPAILSTSRLEPELNGGLGLISASYDPGDDTALGIIRGGGYESTADSGIFNAQINIPAETSAYDSELLNIGFRCVYTP